LRQPYAGNFAQSFNFLTSFSTTSNLSSIVGSAGVSTETAIMKTIHFVLPLTKEGGNMVNIFIEFKSINWKLLVIPALFLAVFLIAYQLNYPIYDWLESYKPRVLLLLQGQNPYTQVVYVPPWFLLLLSPLALLPDRISNAALIALCIFSFFWMLHKAGIKPIYIICFVISYPVIQQLLHRQFDWLVISGALLPPWLGLFLVFSKPQAGLGIAVFWFFSLYKKGGLKKVVINFVPVIIAFLISFLVFGQYMFKAAGREIVASYNASLFPYSIPLGLFLIWQSVKSSNIQLAISASPFLSPYLALYTYAVSIFGLAKNKIWFPILCLASWGLYFIDH
jgi:hypothetical protein